MSFVNDENKVLMITYFFSEEDGVGSLRSRTLFSFLLSKQVKCTVLNKKTKYFLIKLFYKIVFEKYSKVYISCGPFKLLFFVSLLCFIFRKDLVVDFRDPWSLNIYNGYGRGNASFSLFRYKLSVKIEKFSYFSCCKFVVCTEGMYKVYSEIFNNDRKLMLIENGYMFKPNLKNRNNLSSNINFVCVGKFAEYNEEKAEIILSKIKKNIIDKEIFIHFIGANKEKNENIVKKYFSENNYKFLSHLKYEDMIEKLNEYDVGLLMVRDENIEYGTKLFDYIGAGLPFYTDINSDSLLFRRFSSFYFDLDSLSHNVNYINILKHHRSVKYELFKGVLF